MNVLCLGARVIGIETAKESVQAFLTARFGSDPRFRRRLEKLLQVEREGRGAPDSGAGAPKSKAY
jgi:ribose 5-phosphate isomerase B